MAFHYWDAADDSPAIAEITFWHPYASSKETPNYWTGMCVTGTRIITQNGCNCDYVTRSYRGIQLFGSNGDGIVDTNFNYLVLGSNIA